MGDECLLSLVHNIGLAAVQLVYWYNILVLDYWYSTCTGIIHRYWYDILKLVHIKYHSGLAAAVFFSEIILREALV